MSMQEGYDAPAPTPNPSVVGNAFVGQYYHILHHSPESLHKFYQDNSSLTREDNNGVMETVTTMQAINDKILSLNCGELIAEIITVDAQDSHEKGVVVLVTGCMTGKYSLRRSFTQTFFLAPLEKSLGYYVLNDIFRFNDESEAGKNKLSINESANNDSPSATLAAEADLPHPAHQSALDSANLYAENNHDNSPEVIDPSDPGEGSVIEEEIEDPSSEFKEHQTFASVNSAPNSQDDAPKVIEEEIEDPSSEFKEHQTFASVNSAPNSQDDAPKKSYASILKVPKTTSGPVYVVKSSAPATIDHQCPDLAKPATVEDASAQRADNAPESSSFTEEAEGYSIHVRNLPFEATVEQLEEVFKKFGPIKHDGIQVRSNKYQSFCFGFVEFEQPGSVHNAIEASPVIIGDRRSVVEEKRTTTRVGNGGRGRYSSGRGGFRSDSFKGRGNYGASRAYGNNEFRNHGDFHGRPRESNMRNGESNYQPFNQNGSVRGNRRGGIIHSSSSAD